MKIEILLAAAFLAVLLGGKPDLPDLLEKWESVDSQVEELGERKRFLLLVNRTHPLPEGFVPRLAKSFQGNSILLDRAAGQALERMLKAAEEDGYEILISSGYRDRSYQEGLLKEDLAYEKSRGKSQKEAYASVIRETMPPGCSEHETGMAVDLVPYYNQILDERQAETPENQWLLSHCAEYGFILRYPKGKEAITMVDYEPWHFRYVGVLAASEIMEEGLTLEEYVYDRIGQNEASVQTNGGDET